MDNEEVLDEKVLRDGNKLSLMRYQNSCAELLGRPAGSYEIFLRLETSCSCGSTYPSASWYLSVDDYIKLFNAIKDERDWEKTRDFLLDVFRKENGQNLANFLGSL